MRIFLSSTIRDLADYRNAALETIQHLSNDRNQDIAVEMTELHAARAVSPEVHVKGAMASCTVVVGIYGRAYGSVHPQTKRSITETEFDLARSMLKPVLAFVVDVPHRDSLQQVFLNKIQAYDVGVLRRRIASVTELKYQLYRSLSSSVCQVSLEATAERQRRQFLEEMPTYKLRLKGTKSFQRIGKPALTRSPAIATMLAAGARRRTELTLLLGDPGSGKTCALRELFCCLLNEYVRRRRCSPLPVFVALGDIPIGALRAAMSSREPVLPLLSVFLGAEKISSISNLVLGSETHLVVILDGLDELRDTAGCEAIDTGVSMAIRLNEEGHKVFVAGRKYLFDSAQELRRRFSVAAPLAKRTAPKVALIGLCRLSASQVDVYTRAHGIQMRSRAKATLSGSASELLQQPMYLDLYCRIERDSDQPRADLTQHSVGSFMRYCVDRILAIDSLRTGTSSRDAQDHLQRLALWALVEGKACLSIPESSQRKRLWAIARGANLEAGHRLHMARSSIGEMRHGVFEFRHRILLEYFLAEGLLSAIHDRIDIPQLDHFPSKQTDMLLIDLIRLEPDPVMIVQPWIDSRSPVLRYLAAYIVGRVMLARGRSRSRTAMIKQLCRSLRNEADPVVLREMLFTVTTAGKTPPASAIREHMNNPIPLARIRQEILEYYGGIRQARLYLRSRIRTTRGLVRGFYIMSLGSIATPSDRQLLSRIAKRGQGWERRASLATQKHYSFNAERATHGTEA